jgi:hypothetical protein
MGAAAPVGVDHLLEAVMHKARAIFFVCAGIFLLALRAAPAAVAAPPSMLPLEVGNYWEYVSASAGHQVETITATQTLLGRTVFVKSYTGGFNAGLENFWLTGPDGEVMLAGFNHRSFSSALAYDPPITICGGAPLVGDTWTTHTTAYNLADMSVYAVFDITFGALEEVSLSVPAGTFPCIGVGQVPFATSPASTCIAGLGLALDGRQVSATRVDSSTDATDWYSPGVGEVKYVGGDTFELAGYGNTTPARPMSVGQLKARYAK